MFTQKTRILIVDDMATIRRVLIRYCHDLGYFDLVEASNGELAWEKLNESSDAPIGLILSDWNMPSHNGIDFLVKVRAEKKFAKIPFLLITSENEKRELVQAIKAGADDFLVKPFEPQHLAAKLASTYAKLHSTLKSSLRI